MGLCKEMSYLCFLVFRTQEARSCHGQVHPEHTKEQQAADGPQGGHGLSWVGTDGSGGERVCRHRTLVSPPLPFPYLVDRNLADKVRDLDLGWQLLNRALPIPVSGAPSAPAYKVGENEECVCPLFQDCSFREEPLSVRLHICPNPQGTCAKFLDRRHGGLGTAPKHGCVSEQSDYPRLCTLPFVQMGL